MTWVRIASWHLVKEVGPAARYTRCGRRATLDRPTSDVLPLDEKSCEICLRAMAHDAEQRPVDTDPVPA